MILPDGTISEGWIGGGCARAAVLKAAKDALGDGRSRLVSVQPPDLLAGHGVEAGDEQEGIRFAKNMCPSEGTICLLYTSLRLFESALLGRRRANRNGKPGSPGKVGDGDGNRT